MRYADGCTFQMDTKGQACNTGAQWGFLGFFASFWRRLGSMLSFYYGYSRLVGLCPPVKPVDVFDKPEKEGNLAFALFSRPWPIGRCSVLGRRAWLSEALLRSDGSVS
jgi:hypothetical protein